MRTLLLGHSPDPDDAFMFYAMRKDLVDQEGLTFEHELQDIETLNRRALNVELDVSWMVGDSPRDVAAGRRAKCKTIRIRDEHTDDSEIE